MLNEIPTCNDCASVRNDLWEAEWDIRSLSDELEATEREARRLRMEVGAHTCIPDAGAATEGAAS
jgi:NMD protein affecting ribosome stability and mRNA decay